MTVNRGILMEYNGLFLTDYYSTQAPSGGQLSTPKTSYLRRYSLKAKKVQFEIP
jgi:hypothetical protein